MATPTVTAAASTIRPRRRWLRFSLRSLLILVTILSIWLGVKVNQARRQKEAVAALVELGAIVRYEHQKHDTQPYAYDTEKSVNAPGWLRELAGDDFFQTVVHVLFMRPVTDEDLVHLAALPRIERLVLNDNQRAVSDAGMAHLPRPDRLVAFVAHRTALGDDFLRGLGGSDRLEMLGLFGARITDEGFRSLGALPQLTALAIENTHVGDAGLDALDGMPALSAVRLGGKQFTDAGIARLARHKNLTSVYLIDTSISDEGLKHLQALRTLELSLEGNNVRGPGLAFVAPLLNGALVLNGPLIDDASLAYLKEAKNLQALNVEGTAITDAGLAHLHGLPKLTGICLEGTQVTKEGIAKLTKALPGLAVVSKPKGT
jgi:Leucine-rich repeat (LRR) protein